MYYYSTIPAVLALAATTLAVPATLSRRGTGPGTCGNIENGQNGGLSCDSTPGLGCCSSAGWCGDSVEHCGTGCQPQFGKCDGATTGGGNTPAADTPPTTGSTGAVARPKLGSVPYGVGIYNCAVPGTVALTYDDGPWIYTAEVLDILKEFNAKATFFVTGNNIGKGAIDDPSTAWGPIIKRMDADGHQLASHSWTHPDLSTLSETDRRNEMYRLEQALKTLVGKFPTYMRPPFSSCNAACVATMEALGYHIIYFDVDTDDYNNDSPALIVNARNNFKNPIAGTDPTTRDFLSIAHDIHEQTARNLTRFMLETLKAAGYRAVTLGECLGDPIANWYRS